MSHAARAMIIVAMPSKMNIQRQPERLPTPSILMMTEARRPVTTVSRQRLNIVWMTLLTAESTGERCGGIEDADSKWDYGV